MAETGKSIETRMLERRVQELSTLHEIARAVTSVLDLESVLNRIVEAGVYLTNAEEGFLLLVDEESGDLMLRAGKGLGDKASRVMSLKVKDTIAGQVVKTGRPVRMGGFRRDEEYKVKTGYLVKSLVNVPIKWAGQVIGVLAADHSVLSMRSFSDHDVALLSSLAEYAAIAIQNASLFAQASAKADELAKALEEQTGQPPELPPREEDRRAVERLIHSLRSQREEVAWSIESARELAQALQGQAGTAAEVVGRLQLWDEEVLGLLPQLEWLLEGGLLPVPPLAASPLTRTAPDRAEIAATESGPGKELLQYLREGVLVADTQGIVRLANETAAQMLGKPVEKLTNLELEKMIDDPRWERTVRSLQLALAMGNAGTSGAPVSETALSVADRVIHAKLVPIRQNEADTPTHIVAFLHDVSVETQGWHARDEAIAELSHKLRGPMTAIASYSDLLLGDAAELEGALQRRYLERIRRGVERLESVLNEFGDEFTSSPRQSTPVPVHPTSQVINQTVDAMQKELSLDGVNIAREIGPNLPPVQADSEYVSRILTDLLAAAGRRTSVGESVDVSTQVQFEDGEPGHLVVYIQSGGTPGQEASAFEEDKDVRATLALVENAGGRIWTERKPDGSALITLILPVAESVLSDYQSESS